MSSVKVGVIIFFTPRVRLSPLAIGLESAHYTVLTTNFNFMSDQSLLLPNRLTFYSSLISLKQLTRLTNISHRTDSVLAGILPADSVVLPWAPNVHDDVGLHVLGCRVDILGTTNVHVPASPVIPLTYPCSAFLTTGMFEVTALLIARY